MSRVSRARTAKVAAAAPMEDAPAVEDEAHTPTHIESYVLAALNACQRDSSGYTQAVPIFCKLFGEAEEEFLATLAHATVLVLASDAKKSETFDSVATALTTFVARPSADDDKTNRARTWLLKLLLSKVAVSDKATRANACQLIGRTLQALPDDAEIDDDVYDGLESSLLQRTSDAVLDVRVAAVKALRRLKDGDAVAAQLKIVLAGDSSDSVRCAVLSVVGRDAAALPALVHHTRDVSPSVRKLCFVLLTAQLPTLLPALGSAALAAVLKRGVSDRDIAVVAAATNLLAAWLAQLGTDTCSASAGSSPGADVSAAAALVDALAPVQSGSDAEYVVSHMLHARLTQRSSLGVPCPARALTPGRALLWRVALDYAAGRGGVGHRSAADCERHRNPAHADDLLPSTRVFCETLAEAYNASVPGTNGGAADSGAVFTLHQLLRMSVHADTQDAAGIALLRDFLLDLLENLALPSDTVALTLAALRVVLPADSGDTGFRAWESALARRKAAAASAAGGSAARKQLARAVDVHDRFAERATSSSAIVECLGQVVDNIQATLADSPDLAAERAARPALQAAAVAAAAAAAAAPKSGTAVEAARGAWAEYRDACAFEEACWLRLLDIARDLFAQTRASANAQPALEALLVTAVRPVLDGQPGFRSVPLEAAAVHALGLFTLVDTDTARVRRHALELLTLASTGECFVQAAAVKAVGDLLLAFNGLAPQQAAATGAGVAAAEGRLSTEEFGALVSLVTHWAFDISSAVTAAGADNVTVSPDVAHARASAAAVAVDTSFAATEALCKALLYDRVPPADTASALGRLLAALHAPACESRKKQVLTVFFAAYASPQPLPVGAPAPDPFAVVPTAADAGAGAGADAEDNEKEESDDEKSRERALLQSWCDPFSVGSSDHSSMLTQSVLPLVAALHTPAAAAAEAGGDKTALSEPLTAALRLLMHLVADKTAASAPDAEATRRSAGAASALLPARVTGTGVVFALGHYNTPLNTAAAQALPALPRLVVELLLAVDVLAGAAPLALQALGAALEGVDRAHPDVRIAAPAGAAEPAVSLVRLPLAVVDAAVRAQNDPDARGVAGLVPERGEEKPSPAAAAWAAAVVDARHSAIVAAVDADADVWKRAADAGAAATAGGGRKASTRRAAKAL